MGPVLFIYESGVPAGITGRGRGPDEKGAIWAKDGVLWEQGR